MSRMNWDEAVNEWLQSKTTVEVEQYRNEIAERGFCAAFHGSLTGEQRGLYKEAMRSRRKRSRTRATESVAAAVVAAQVSPKRGRKKKRSIHSSESRRRAAKYDANRARSLAHASACVGSRSQPFVAMEPALLSDKLGCLQEGWWDSSGNSLSAVA